MKPSTSAKKMTWSIAAAIAIAVDDVGGDDVDEHVDHAYWSVEVALEAPG